MTADWRQTNWFDSCGGAGTCAPRYGSSTWGSHCRYHVRLRLRSVSQKAERLRKNSLLLPAILLQGGQLDASADQFEEIHMEPPAYMDDFFHASHDTATQLPNGLQLNMASNKTEAVDDSRGKGRQQVWEDLWREFRQWWMVSGRQQSKLRRAFRSGW